MRKLFAWSMVLTLLFAPSANLLADQSAETASAAKAESVELKNVELSSEGALKGQLITESGVPMNGRDISVKVGEQTFSAKTDDSGRFEISGLQGGRCLLTVGEETFACRLWIAGTAPPSALKSIALVGASGDATVRGQSRIPVVGNRLAALTTGQKVGLGLLALGGTAVAIAVSQDDDASN